MAFSYQVPQSRRVGMRREKLSYSLLQNGPQVKAAPREQKQRSPSIDIDAPPRDSSDDASTVHDFELSDTDSLPSKKRKTGKYELAFDSTGSKGPHGGSNDATSELANEPSNIRSTSFASSNVRSRRLNGPQTSFKCPGSAVRAIAEEAFIDMWTAKPKKTKAMYGTNSKNIHVAALPREKKKDTEGKSISPVKKSKTGFRTFNHKAVEPLLDKIEDPTAEAFFKAPPSQETTPRSKRASNRLSRTNQASPQEGRPSVFQQPNLPFSRDATPTKGPTPQGFVVPRALPDSVNTSKATMSSESERKPETIEVIKQTGLGDLKNLVALSKDKLMMPDLQYREPTSSVTVSSIPSTSFDDDSSLSSISSAPVSPVLEALREQFSFPKLGNAKYYDYPSAKCPICQEPVERSFLQEFDSGKRLNVRQQVRFCKAHRMKSAENEWQAKRYPRIDWTRLSERLGRFHPVVDDILKGDKPSFYRNAFEDQIKGGQNRTLQQIMLTGHGFEGLAPGYYGSKGSRLITENIMTSFAPKVRRLAASDKLIASAGVAGYVQAVLAPELAVMLVMEDMRVDEDEARAILRNSKEIGDLLNEEEDEMIRDEDGGDT